MHRQRDWSAGVTYDYIDVKGRRCHWVVLKDSLCLGSVVVSRRGGQQVAAGVDDGTGCEVTGARGFPLEHISDQLQGPASLLLSGHCGGEGWGVILTTPIYRRG